MTDPDGTHENEGGGFAVPNEYSNEGWAKDLKSYPEVWTKLAGSEKLIGQKVEGKIDLLKEDSKPEEVNAFYKTLGRPDEAKSYAFNREGQPEEMKNYQSDEADNVVKEIFHKYGLTNKQATGIQKDYEKMLEAQLLEQIETQKKSDLSFDEAVAKTFGNDKDAVLASSKALLEKFTPEGYGDHIKTLDNDSLIVMAGVLNNIKNTYISEDAFNTLKGGGGSGGNSEAELRARAKELMASKEWTDPFNPRNKEVKDEVKELYRQVGEME